MVYIASMTHVTAYEGHNKKLDLMEMCVQRILPCTEQAASDKIQGFTLPKIVLTM